MTVQTHQFGRTSRHLTKQQRVDKSEGGTGCSDSDRQYSDNDQTEARRTAPHTHGVKSVLFKRLQEGKAPLLAITFPDLRNTSKVSQCCLSRFVRREPATF